MMTDNDKVLDPDVKPLYIVTGSTDSMGSVITRKLAEQGKAVLLASRDIAKAENYATQLRNVTRNKDITCLQLDLNSFELVNDFVRRLRELNRPVAALINNAGLLPRRSEISPDGFEHAAASSCLPACHAASCHCPMSFLPCHTSRLGEPMPRANWRSRCSQFTCRA